MNVAAIVDRRRFILDNTRLQQPPHTPEIQLHLADEITPIWRMTEEELGALGLPPPYWAFAWAGGQAVARYVLDHPHEVAGLRVLDFASGSGLVAIAAMLSGAAETLAADIDNFCAAAIALNAAAHRRSVRVLIGDPGRSYFPKSGLMRLAEYRVVTTRELEDQEIKRTGVFTFPPANR